MEKKFWIAVVALIISLIIFTLIVLDLAKNSQSTTVILPVKNIKVLELTEGNAEDCLDLMDALDYTIPGIMSATSGDKKIIFEYDMVKISINSIMNYAQKAGCNTQKYRDYKKGDKPKKSSQKMIMKCGAGKCGSSMMQEVK